MLERTDVMALKAAGDVSMSFLSADRHEPSAPNMSAAWAVCSVFKDLRTPKHVNAILTAAIVDRCGGPIPINCGVGAAAKHGLLLGLLLLPWRRPFIHRSCHRRCFVELA